jgi:hypothetical protein
MSCERIKIDYNLLVPVEGCNTITVTYKLVGEDDYITVEVQKTAYIGANGIIIYRYPVSTIGVLDFINNEWVLNNNSFPFFVGVGYSGAVATGRWGTWNTNGGASSNNNWQSVASNGNIIVAVASENIGSRVMTSFDGQTWNARNPATNNDWRAICYGEDNGLFVAVSSTGTGNRVMTSPDGVTWTSRTSAGDFLWLSVTYGGGYFVAVGFDGSNGKIMTSNDGITWTLLSTSITSHLRSVTYGNGQFVAVGSSGTTRVYTSVDGITWIGQTSPIKDWTSITYGNNLYIATAVDYYSTVDTIMKSEDGVSWVAISGGILSLSCIAYGEFNDNPLLATYNIKQFQILSQNGVNRSWLSLDGGLEWGGNNNSYIDNRVWNAVTFHNNFKTYTRLSENTECPFGNYSIEDGSYLEYFSVGPKLIPSVDQSVIAEAIDIYNNKYVYLVTIEGLEYIVFYNGNNPPQAPWVMFALESDVTWDLESTADCPYGEYSYFSQFGGTRYFAYFNIVEVPIDPNDELINCYKLAVWKEQCEFSKCVLKYLQQLQFGINNCEALEKLKNKRRVLNILNCYDPRDILYNTTIYNSITYSEIKQLLNYL